MKPNAYRIEICSSCLRAAGLVTGREDRERILTTLQAQLTGSNLHESLRLELGQCQRVCDDRHITLTESEIIPDENYGERFGDAVLNLTPQPTEQSLIATILATGKSPRG
jgi:hypothetical protein